MVPEGVWVGWETLDPAGKPTRSCHSPAFCPAWGLSSRQKDAGPSLGAEQMPPSQQPRLLLAWHQHYLGGVHEASTECVMWGFPPCTPALDQDSEAATNRAAPSMN